MKIGVLTGGGDCPGLNAVIRGIVIRGIQFGYDFVGIKDGWLGLLKGDIIDLTRENTSAILPRGGTILGTSRTNPMKKEEDKGLLLNNIEELGLDVIVAIGGDDTLGVASKLNDLGVKTVGVPKTIDNDLSGTDFTFGFDTAVGIISEALDRLHTTAEAHHRAMVVETMGRHAGWLALYGGLAGGADIILIPEEPFDIETVCNTVRRDRDNGKNFTIVVAAEGAHPKEAGGMIKKDKPTDAFGNVALGGVGDLLAAEIEKRTGVETRSVVLGHIQRGGTPTAYDRILATRYGVAAIELVHSGKFGHMVALRGNSIESVPLKDATSVTKTVTKDMYDVAKVFFEK